MASGFFNVSFKKIVFKTCYFRLKLVLVAALVHIRTLIFFFLRPNTLQPQCSLNGFRTALRIQEALESLQAFDPTSPKKFENEQEHVLFSFKGTTLKGSVL